MSGPDLFVVCKSCGSEVSPYITECPYCGTRLRKRAPKLEKPGGPPVKPPKPSRATRAIKQPKPARQPRARRESRREGSPRARPERPLVTILLVGIPFVLLPILVTIAFRAGLEALAELPLLGALDGEYWRLLSYTLLYQGTGYELVALSVIALFGYLLERRHGFWAPLLVFVAGAVAGAGLAILVEGDAVFASGGNGAALALLGAWVVWDLLERRRGEDTDSDLLGVLVIAVVVILLPLASQDANWWVTVGGGLTGLLLGVPLARLHKG